MNVNIVFNDTDTKEINSYVGYIKAKTFEKDGPYGDHCYTLDADDGYIYADKNCTKTIICKSIDEAFDMILKGSTVYVVFNGDICGLYKISSIEYDKLNYRFIATLFTKTPNTDKTKWEPEVITYYIERPEDIPIPE